MESPLVKTPPSSLAMEKAILFSLLIDPQMAQQVQAILQPGDFYDKVNKAVYKAIVAISANDVPLDSAMLIEYLVDHGASSNIKEYLHKLLAETEADPSNIDAYATVVKEKSILRELRNTSLSIFNLAHQSENPEQAISQAQEELLSVAKQQTVRGNVVTMVDALTEVLNGLEVRIANPVKVRGVPTGIIKMDEDYLNGFQPSDLIIMAARPSMGKTAAMLGIIHHAATQQYPCLIFSLEMSTSQLIERLISSISEVESMKIRTGFLDEREKEKVRKAAEMLAQCPIYIDDTPGLSPMKIRSISNKLMIETKGALKMIAVDYLQLMSADSTHKSDGNRNFEIGAASKALKNLGRELSVPMLVLSQLSRAVEARQDKRPILSDLRDSGEVEQNADVVIFIYRDEYYYKEKSEKPGIGEFIIAKQRNGPIGTIEMVWHQKAAKYLNMKYQAPAYEIPSLPPEMP